MSIGQTIKHTILLITLAVAAQAQTYEVAGCEFLNMREGPACTYPVNQRLQSGVNGIVLIGKPVFNGAIKWQQVNSRGVIGWVNAFYLKRLAPPKTTAGSYFSASEVAAYNADVSTRQVEILSEPPGARIEVNDDYIGDTPITTTFECDIDGRFMEITSIRALPTQPGDYVQSKLFFGGYLNHARFAANYSPSTLNNKIPARIFFDMRLGPVSSDINVNVQ
jgi:PEGA domain.